MAGAVLVQHHAWQRAAFAALTVCAAPFSLDHQPGLLQYPLGPGVGALHSVRLAQFLVKMLGGEAAVTLAIKILNREHLVHRCASRRYRANALIDQPLQPLGLIAARPAPHGTYVHAQNLSGLLLHQPPGLPASIYLFEAHLSDLL